MDQKEFLTRKIESDTKIQNEPIKKTKYEEMKEYAALIQKTLGHSNNLNNINKIQKETKNQSQIIQTIAQQPILYNQPQLKEQPQQIYTQNLNMFCGPLNIATSKNILKNKDYFNHNYFNNNLGGGGNYTNYNNYFGIGKLNYTNPFNYQNLLKNQYSHSNPPVQKKPQYVIKDEGMTVENILQRKEIQDKYLNPVKDEKKNMMNLSNNITNVNINNNNYSYNYNINSTPQKIQNKINNPITNPINNSINNSINKPINKPITNPINTSSTNKNKTNEKKEDFPIKLQEYIKRAFQRCKNNEETKRCQKSLFAIMKDTISKDDMFTRNWDIYPLPNIKSDEHIHIPNINQNNIPNQNHNNTTHNIINNNNPLFEYNTEKNHKKNTNTISYSYGTIDSFASNYPIPLQKPTNQNNKKIKKPTTNNQNQSNHFSKFISEDSIKHEIESYKPIIGTCTDLEKNYFRMIDTPDPSEVRPEYILKKSLNMLEEKWSKKLNDYKYFDEQFRSMRQDLTVQLIQNEFTVKVYETNAKIALESHDISQFNQCQSALIPLYEKGIKGHKNEFFAYRILYTALCQDKENISILKIIKQKFKNKKNLSFEINHAIQVMKSLNEPNYFNFFKLYKNAPNMGKYLIEPFIPRLRIKGLLYLAYGYFSEVPIDVIVEKLGFENKEFCLKFLNDNELKIGIDKNGVDVFYGRENFSALNSSPLLQVLMQKKF